MKRARLACAAFAVIALTASLATAAPSVTSSNSVNSAMRAEVVAYLQTIGVNTTHVVFQTGARNYAGPNCPGKGWTCTGTDQPVVQSSSTESAVNSYDCSGTVSDGGNTCIVVQRSAGGANSARCFLRANASPVTQSCSITQVNTSGNNTATVDQDVVQGKGLAQVATQSAEIVQRNATGANSYSVAQDIGQASRAGSSAAIVQSQKATQSIASDQRTSATGANSASTAQKLDLDMHSNGGTSAEQRQNADSTEPDARFSAHQQSDGGGANTHSASQLGDYQAVANLAPAATTQTQGSPNGGQSGALKQISSGVSSTQVSQRERQHMIGNGETGQEQYGPHICCDQSTVQLPDPDLTSFAPSSAGRTAKANDTATASSTTERNQQGNAGNSFKIDQLTDQNADGPAFQDDLSVGVFSSSGSGTITQTSRQNDGTNTSSCTGSVCTLSQSCINGNCDAAPPQTTITASPAVATTSTSATFTFDSDQVPSTFECSLDGSGFAACASPKAYVGLADGIHTFRVRAIDASSNPDPTPAIFSWRIDRTGPSSNFDAGQDGQIYVPGDPLGDPTLNGTATDAGSGVQKVTVTFRDGFFGSTSSAEATLTCNAGATSCTWSVRLPSTPGSYQATKKATDFAGNVEADDGETISFTVVP